MSDIGNRLERCEGLYTALDMQGVDQMRGGMIEMGWERTERDFPQQVQKCVFASVRKYSDLTSNGSPERDSEENKAWQALWQDEGDQGEHDTGDSERVNE